jgi:LysR family transcriptional regulator, nitrogen assimilation regulatory protein
MGDNCPVMIDDLLQQSGLSLDRLQSFCRVAELGGVTKAAKGDPTRQSLFSRQIKELEEFFGVELVRRKGRGVALTAAGERLHMLAREQLLALSDFKKACAGESVQITVAAGDSLIQWVLLRRIRDIRHRLSDVSFRVLNLPTTEITARMRDGTVDLGLVREGSIARPLQASPLGTMTFSLFVPAQMFPGTKPKSLPPEALVKLPLATLEGTGQFRQELDRLFARQKAGPSAQLELSSFPLVAQAVQTGAFAAILPSIASAEFARSETVELKLDVLRSLNRGMVLAWNPRMARIRAAVGKAIPAFRDLCRLQ